MSGYVLYRAFDADRRLLYVGITSNMAERLRHHARSSAWAQEATHFLTDSFGTQVDALAAERDAIANERPMHNVPGEERSARSLAARVAGHTLRSEGGAFSASGTRVRPYGGIGGEGRALCSCGTLSPLLHSGAERKQWHRDHKAGQAS